MFLMVSVNLCIQILAVLDISFLSKALCKGNLYEIRLLVDISFYSTCWLIHMEMVLLQLQQSKN